MTIWMSISRLLEIDLARRVFGKGFAFPLAGSIGYLILFGVLGV